MNREPPAIPVAGEGEDKENGDPLAASSKPSKKITPEDEAPAPKEMTREEKEALAKKRLEQASSISRLNQAPAGREKNPAAVGRDFADYKRKCGLAEDTKVFCMTGWQRSPRGSS